MSHIDALVAEQYPGGVEFRDLAELIRLNFGTRITKMKDAGTLYPVYGGGGESFRTDNFNREDEYVVSRFAMSERCVRKVKGRFWMLDSGFTFDVETPEVLKDFVAHWLFAHQPEIYACSSQGAQKNIRTDKFKRLRIPVPPLAIQRKIISILDELEVLTAQLQAELQAEHDLRSRQHTFYRGGLLHSTKSAPTSLIRDVVDLVNAKAHEKVVDPAGSVALMTARFVSSGVANRFVQPEDVLTPAYEGDVALVMSDLPNGRALARTFYVDSDDRYAANQRVCLLRSRDTTVLVPRFLHYVMDRNPQLLAYNNGMDQTHLKKDYILDVRIPVPPVNEQQRIIRILDEFDAHVASLAAGLGVEIAARRQQYEYYRNKLLTFEEAA